jgi:hypothetical protein
MPRNFDEINDSTGFANGDKFESEGQVREYFQLDELKRMTSGIGPGVDQATLDRYADIVIEEKWHCKF